MTESRGPVIPMSLMYAVPFGRTRASAVGTWVWVPTTALTRPSRYQPIAFFSEVISQWKSRIRIGGSGSAAPSSSSSSLMNGESSWFMNTRPIALMTATSSPSSVWWISQPRPGASSG